jgi:hypothetical protein
VVLAVFVCEIRTARGAGIRLRVDLCAADIADWTLPHEEKRHDQRGKDHARDADEKFHAPKYHVGCGPPVSPEGRRRAFGSKKPGFCDVHVQKWRFFPTRVFRAVAASAQGGSGWVYRRAWIRTLGRSRRGPTLGSKKRSSG